MSGIAIGEHAFLSDCRTSALVTREGSVDWLCLPRLDSAPSLGRLLDDDAGHLLLAPSGPGWDAERRYLPQSLVLETTWTGATGQLQVHDALALGEHEHGHDLGRSSPGVLLRHARCTAGTVALRLEWAPRPEFGLVHPRLVPVPGGLCTSGGATVVQLSTDVPLRVDGATATAEVLLREASSWRWPWSRSMPGAPRRSRGSRGRCAGGSTAPPGPGAAGPLCTSATTGRSRSRSTPAAWCCRA